MPKKPQFVGVPQGTDPVVQEYMAGVAKRAKAAGVAQQVPMPNLAQAQAQFDPKKDGALTLAQIGAAQQNAAAVAEGEGQRSGLSAETARGLQALQQQVKQQQSQSQGEPPVEQTETEEAPQAEEEKAAPAPESPARVSEAIAEADDLELDYLMSRARQDAINNEEQQKIIEARVKPMDLSTGITTGEFRQLVPIKPGVLEVMYRTVSPMEMEHIRRLVLEMQLRDERMSNLSVDRFTLMQTVAAIVHIGGQALPAHIKNPGTLEAEFLDDVFSQKYSIIGGYPSPMIHALSTHAYWFDMRVRRLFTMEALKNGRRLRSAGHAPT
jgi:hypothetical protein